MSSKSEKINAVILKLHQNLKKEWLSLKEINDELIREGNDIGIYVVANILEQGCRLSNNFSGKEQYRTKEMGSGLYKAIEYDRIEVINSLNIGEVFTREQLMNMFKISGQSGIMPTRTLNCMVLTTAVNNGIYGDSLVENGNIIYTGQGLIGNQTLEGSNGKIATSNETKNPIYLFSKDRNRKYTFEGRVVLDAVPYQTTEKDINNNDRLVWKFPLRIEKGTEKVEEVNEDQIIYVVEQIETINQALVAEDVSTEWHVEEGPLNIRKYRKRK